VCQVGKWQPDATEGEYMAGLDVENDGRVCDVNMLLSRH